MQKDSVVNTIGSVMLDPTGGNNPGVIRNITDVIVVQSDGTQTALGLGGYLDIGLLDTMEDLFVNFIGALTFSIIGYFYVRSRGKNKFAKRFIPVVNEEPQPQAKNTSAEDAPETEKTKRNNQQKQAPCCEKHSRALEFLYRKHKNKPRRITKRNPARFMELVRT